MNVRFDSNLFETVPSWREYEHSAVVRDVIRRDTWTIEFGGRALTVEIKSVDGPALRIRSHLSQLLRWARTIFIPVDMHSPSDKFARRLRNEIVHEATARRILFDQVRAVGHRRFLSEHELGHYW